MDEQKEMSGEEKNTYFSDKQRDSSIIGQIASINETIEKAMKVMGVVLESRKVYKVCHEKLSTDTKLKSVILVDNIRQLLMFAIIGGKKVLEHFIEERKKGKNKIKLDSKKSECDREIKELEDNVSKLLEMSDEIYKELLESLDMIQNEVLNGE